MFKDNNLNETTSKILIFILFFYLFFYFLLNFYMYERIGLYKSKSAENIQEGCAYLVRKTGSRGGGFDYYLSINNSTYIDAGISLADFPFRRKTKDFYKAMNLNPSGCHRIKYIYINFIIFRKMYIYDFFN